MSARPKAQDQNQTTMEQQASYSALLFFVQEVSKLNSPAPSTWLNETSLSTLRKEEEEEESHRREVTALTHPRPELCSPWRVMNLIDRQCEQLQHHGDGGESEPGSDLTDREYTGDCVSIKCSVSPFPLISETEDTAPCGLLVEDVRCCSEGKCCLQPLCCVKHSSTGCCVHSQTEVKPVKEEEEELSVDGGTQQPEERSSSDQDVLNELFSTNTSSPVHIPQLSLSDEPLTSPSSEDKSPALTLDHNANLISASEVSSSPPSLLFSYAETCYSLLRQESSGCTGDAKLSPSEASKPEPSPEQQEEVAPPVRRSNRKQAHPSRSADIQDPGFQGVTFRIDTELDDSREQCRLHIISKFR